MQTYFLKYEKNYFFKKKKILYAVYIKRFFHALQMKYSQESKIRLGKNFYNISNIMGNSCSKNCICTTRNYILNY